MTRWEAHVWCMDLVSGLSDCTLRTGKADEKRDGGLSHGADYRRAIEMSSITSERVLVVEKGVGGFCYSRRE
ncbi:hypothetical protein U1Q18_016295 [Sarracenia purpurea var. burkii]